MNGSSRWWDLRALVVAFCGGLWMSWGLCGSAWSAEEAFDLEKDAPPPPAAAHSAAAASKSSGFSLMGRVDLTGELGHPEQAAGGTLSAQDKSLQNYHFFLFLKAKPSERVGFMGEFVGRTFFEVEYEAASFASVKFGKLIVPFGDTRYFHHFYGGIQGYGTLGGVMLPNVWAAPGLDVVWKAGATQLDTYVVNAISATDATSDPDFQSSSAIRQAFGARLTQSSISRLTFVLSGYQANYYDHRPLLMGGADVYTDYGFLSEWGAVPRWFFRTFRFSFGRAHAWVYRSVSALGSRYEKHGDYFQLATKAMGPGELRVRYGTYVSDSRRVTSSDRHNFSVGYQMPIDVLRILAEYQWNYEAVNEFNNDVARVMVSLDF